MSIKYKLILNIALVFSIFGLVLGVFIYWQNYKVLSNHLNVDIDNTINQTAQLINFYTNRAENNLTSLAVDPEVIVALAAKDSAKLGLLTQKITAIKSISNILENVAIFEVTSSTCIAWASDSSDQAMLGRDFSDRDYCQGVLGSQATYLSSAYIGAISNHPVLGLAIPIKNYQGEMLGFVYGSINLDELRGYLWDSQQGQNSKVEILDRNGVLFLNTEEKITALNALTTEEREELDEIKTSIKANKVTGIIKDVDNFVGYKYNGVLTVIYEKNATTLLALAKTLTLIISVALVLTIVIVIIIIFLFLGGVTNKISRLSRITKEISSGKFNFELTDAELTARDEMSILIRSFNEMANKLTDLYKNLDLKVKERTKKLEQTDTNLKKALLESEKMNKLMVGRELDMLKLKQEIKELKKK